MGNNNGVAPSELMGSSAATASRSEEARCSWCNVSPIEAAWRREGPHATWCIHHREEHRGGLDQAARSASEEPCSEAVDKAEPA
jgi:hypothetical protein